ncbi:MAG: tetratricopeptide repeat protein, partial [Limisphaerales bacterium]
MIAVCAAILLAGCQPPGPKSLLLGEKYLEQGNYEKALRYLTRASELMPEHPQVWNYLGLAYHGAQRPVEAAEKYQRAIRIDRNLPAPHYNLGSLFLEQGHLPQAVAELNAFVTLETNSAQGWTKLGTALLRMRRADEAERALMQALKIDPKIAEAHNGMGLAHIQRKRPREAMLSFNNALQYKTGYSPALLNQAVIAHQHFGNKQMALERYQAFLSTKPDAKTAAQVQAVVSTLQKEIAGVQVAEAESAETEEPVRAETNAFAAALRTNAPPRTAVVVTNQPALAATNLAVRTPSTKTNNLQAPPTTNIVAAATQQQTNVVPRRATNAVATTMASNVTKAPMIVATQPEVKPESEPEPEPEVEEPLTVEVVSVTSEPEFRPVSDLAPIKPASTNSSVATVETPDTRPLIIPR